MLLASVLLFSLSYGDSAIVQSGLDVVVREGFRSFHNKRVGLITNHTAVDRDGRHIADLFHEAPGVQLKALFGPEHGIRGAAEGGEKIATQIDATTGVPIHSLYGKTFKPTSEMLAGLDALVFDMQDVGARFYTYISTMALAMEAAAEHDLEFYVLDRPNPIGGRVEGPVLDAQHRSFVGIHAIALRHGMTIGELARMFWGEGWYRRSSLDTLRKASPKKDWNKFHVIALQGWHRNQLFHETGLPWIPPSPNMTDETTAQLYPGMGLLEATNFSEGRGTAEPFKLVGAPWLDSGKLLALLEGKVAGVAIDTASFIPQDLPGKAMNPKFEGELCRALRFKVVSPAEFESVKFGVALLWGLHRLHADRFTISPPRMARMFGAAWLHEMISTGADLHALWQRMGEDEEKFRELREKYLLYED